jgi:hypothetical protein
LKEHYKLIRPTDCRKSKAEIQTKKSSVKNERMNIILIKRRYRRFLFECSATFVHAVRFSMFPRTGKWELYFYDLLTAWWKYHRAFFFFTAVKLRLDAARLSTGSGRVGSLGQSASL